MEFEEQKTHHCLKRLDRAIRQCNPSHVFSLFSGGHDSLAATYIASRHPRFSAAVHINTGIGIPQTRKFVRKTCQEQNWKLLEYKAIENLNAKGKPDPQVYEKILLRYGFPGPTRFGHNLMYNRLKERQIRQLIRDHKLHRNDKVLLVSGCRSQESQRRMGHVKEIQFDGSRVWSAIIHDWSKQDVERFITRIGLTPNPVVKLLCKSGECLCGAFARKGELTEIGLFYPAVAQEICDLERRVKKKFPWGWEERPPAWWVARRKTKQDKILKQPMPLCMSCEKGHEKTLIDD